jgi:putative transposase
MTTYTQIIYQVVFGTKGRVPSLTRNNRDELYKYISGILKKKECHLYRINGVEDHIHILTHIHPTVALADMIKDIKLASSEYIIKNKLFNKFNAWQEGYGAFTYSIREKNILIEYIKNQENHHRKITFREEYIELLNDHGIEFDEKYLL